MHSGASVKWGEDMVRIRATRHFVTVTLGCMLANPALAAGAPPTASPQAIQATIDCRKITDGQARLACYDSAVDALGQAIGQGQVVAVDREQVQAVRKQAFGFTLPSLSILDRGEKPEEVSEVRLAVESARRMADGKWLIRLEGGQVWRQIDGSRFSRDPKPGAQAVIKKAILGSYMMMIGGKSPVRVHRDE